MSVRNLKSLFKPQSVALIGASTHPGSVGAVLARNLFKAGFAGPVMPVNPKHRAIEGVLTYPDIASLPMTPDLAVISTPPDTVPGLIAELGRRGTKAAVVITAGFGEGEDRVGGALRQAMLSAARPHLLRIVGPNCLGIMVPRLALNATFAHLEPPAGDLAFVTQSGAILTSVLDWTNPRGIGFSHIVSLGDMADVDFGDMLDYLAGDAETRAILLYIEAVTDARKFMSAARIAARAKPVLVVKAGRRAEGAKAATSHTGAMAGADDVYDAAIQRAGMLRVYELDEMFDAVETLAMCRPAEGDRLAIVTNGGGLGVMATDSLVEQGGRLAGLAPETLEKLGRVLPRTWSHGNPVDIIGDAPPERYKAALSVLLEAREADAILVLNAPTAVASSVDAARAVIEAVAPGAAAGRRPNLFTSWVGESTAAAARRLFAAAHLPSYATPNQAVRGFMHMVRYRRNQTLLMQVPPSIPEDFAPDRAKARRIIEGALAAGRELLSEPEAKEVLAAYGVPVVPTRIARDPAEAARIARDFAAPCALKVLSPAITHKSDVGGVALDLETPAAVEEAAAAMLARLARSHPEAPIEGFTVEPMVRRAGAHELILGIAEDPQFGPIVLFGHGGTAAEVIGDKAVALPPLNLALAQALIARTRVHRLLQGFRSQPAAALEAIALAVVKVSQLAVDFAEIAELDINPLFADAQGISALDARIRIRRATRPAAARLAIRPYPSELEEEVRLDGRAFLLRPVRPEDAPRFVDAFESLAPEDIRMRFFAPLKALSLALLARLTQLDYDREMALVLFEATNGRRLAGVVRIAADPDNETAEFAVTVRSDLKGHGIGLFLMGRIIDYARRRGIRTLEGDVLRENEPMLRLCRELGFALRSLPEDPEIVEVSLALQATASSRA